MTFIDWSDAEGMFGLLVEFVADERAACPADPERRRFLSDLLGQLQEFEGSLEDVPGSVLLDRLKRTYDATDRRFVGDPVMVHVSDCIDELERIEREDERCRH